MLPPVECWRQKEYKAGAVQVLHNIVLYCILQFTVAVAELGKQKAICICIFAITLTEKLASFRTCLF